MSLLSSGSSSADRLCPAGCASCSAVNGCLSCKPRLFFHLEQDGMRQKGACLSSCPRGYYGKRSPRTNTCNSKQRRRVLLQSTISKSMNNNCCCFWRPAGCKEECHSCFSEHFCTRCPPGRFLFWGKCEISCPNGLTANTLLRECTGEPLHITNGSSTAARLKHWNCGGATLA